jgi:polysaccharide export outer membrane protein
MPLVGDVKAGGRTPSEVRRDIQGRVERFLKSEAANVTVGVVQANSYFFTITGNIDKPGRYTATEYVTLLEAMALGGEPNRFATPERMMIVRRDSNGGTRVIPIDYTTLKSGVRMEQNIVVLAGDLIIVP